MGCCPAAKPIDRASVLLGADMRSEQVSNKGAAAEAVHIVMQYLLGIQANRSYWQRDFSESLEAIAPLLPRVEAEYNELMLRHVTNDPEASEKSVHFDVIDSRQGERLLSESVALCAAFLKSFLRRLPQPLLQNSLLHIWRVWADSKATETPSRLLAKIRKILLREPPLVLSTFGHLVRLLQLLRRHANTRKSARPLKIIIVRELWKNSNNLTDFEAQLVAESFVEFAVCHVDRLFCDPLTGEHYHQCQFCLSPSANCETGAAQIPRTPHLLHCQR